MSKKTTNLRVKGTILLFIFLSFGFLLFAYTSSSLKRGALFVEEALLKPFRLAGIPRSTPYKYCNSSVKINEVCPIRTGFSNDSSVNLTLLDVDRFIYNRSILSLINSKCPEGLWCLKSESSFSDKWLSLCDKQDCLNNLTSSQEHCISKVCNFYVCYC